MLLVIQVSKVLLSGKKPQRGARTQAGVITPGFEVLHNPSPEGATENLNNLLSGA